MISNHLTWRRLGHEIKIHHIWNPQRHQLQHHTSQVTPAAHTAQGNRLLNHSDLNVSTTRSVSAHSVYSGLHQPLNLRHSHGNEVVEFLLSVEAVAGAGVLSACSARSLPGLCFRNTLHRQHLQTTVFRVTQHVCIKMSTNKPRVNRVRSQSYQD